MNASVEDLDAIIGDDASSDNEKKLAKRAKDIVVGKQRVTRKFYGRDLGIVEKICVNSGIPVRIVSYGGRPHHCVVTTHPDAIDVLRNVLDVWMEESHDAVLQASRSALAPFAENISGVGVKRKRRRRLNQSELSDALSKKVGGG